MIESNPIYGHAIIEPHLFWLAMASFAICILLIRRAERRERQWAEEDETEMKKHEAFKKAMDKK